MSAEYSVNRLSIDISLICISGMLRMHVNLCRSCQCFFFSFQGHSSGEQKSKQRRTGRWVLKQKTFFFFFFGLLTHFQVTWSLYVNVAVLFMQWQLCVQCAVICPALQIIFTFRGKLGKYKKNAQESFSVKTDLVLRTKVPCRGEYNVSYTSS